MVGVLSLLIFLFTLIIYLLSHFLHTVLFTTDIGIFVVAILPIIGIIFAVWSHGFIKFISMLGNISVLVFATIIPIILFYF